MSVRRPDASPGSGAPACRERPGTGKPTRLSPAGFHTAGWALWLTAGLVAAMSLGDPAALLISLAAVVAVVHVFAPGPAERRGFALILGLGGAMLTLRVLLFGLTGRAGETVLVTLPAVRLPAWAGGFTVGGPVMGEVVAHAAMEGLRLALVIACFGAFVAVTDVYRVLRMLPRFLAEAGLVLSIALAFVPVLFRTIGEVRDAQRLRGHRVRGIRGALPLVVPVLAGALERAMSLAEAMELRGYGQLAPGSARKEAHARACILGGLVALVSGGALVLYGTGPRGAGATLLLAGGGGVAGGLGALSRLVPRTRLRADPADRWDRLLAGAALLAAGAGLAAGSAGGWSPYPHLTLPAPHPGAVAAATALGLPVAIDVLRARALVRAERRHADHPLARSGRSSAVAGSAVAGSAVAGSAVAGSAAAGSAVWPEVAP